VTLGGFCVFAVIFSAVYAKRTEVALGICSILFVLMPTYFVHNYEVPFNNWLLGSVLRQPQSGPSPGPSPNPHPGLHRQVSPMSASKGEVLSAVWSASPNTSRYDEMLGLSVVGLSLMHFSMFNPGIALIINTSEVHQQGSMDHGHSAWLAAGCPCGHPPLQRPSRLLKAALGPRGLLPLGCPREAGGGALLPRPQPLMPLPLPVQVPRACCRWWGARTAPQTTSSRT
jgi:hypothetical protein